MDHLPARPFAVGVFVQSPIGLVKSCSANRVKPGGSLGPEADATAAPGRARPGTPVTERGSTWHDMMAKSAAPLTTSRRPVTNTGALCWSAMFVLQLR